MSKALARTCLASLIALCAMTPVRADDWSLTRERPSRPARRPERPAARPPTSSPRSPAAGDRLLREALRDPSSDLLVDTLVSRRRRASGGLEALREALRARGSVEARVLLARLDAEGGELDAARDALRRLVREEPRSPLAAKTLAAIERRHGDPSRIGGWLDVALERTEDAASREALLREKMAFHLDRGELEAAEKSVKALFAARPRDLALRLEWARELSRRENAARAVVAFEEALAMARGDARVATPVRVELARARLSAGDPAGALREVQRASRASGAVAFRAALLELELAAHRELGTLAELARSLASRRDVDSVVARAYVLDELGEDEGALAAFQSAVRRRPRDRDLRAALARLYARLGRLEDVVEEYRRLVRDSAGDPTFVRELALLYDRMGRRPEAERLLDGLVRRHPRSAGVARVNAEIRERFGDRDALRAALTHWKRADPQDPEPRVALGAELLAAGDRAGAVREMMSLLDLRGDPVEKRLTVAKVLADHDLLAEAEEVVRPLSPRTEDDLEVARVTASILERPRAEESAEARSERNRRAEALWRRVLSHPGADAESRREARRHVVHLVRREQKLNAMIERLEAAVARDPDDHESARLLVEAHLARDPEHPERALAVLEALSRRARDADVLAELVRVKRKAGDREGEIELLERLVSLDARGASRHLDRLVELSLELYRDEDALRFATEAARRAPHDPEAHRRLGALYRERREIEDAISAYGRAIALDDAHVPTLTALAALELAKGRIDESLDLQLRVVRVSPDDEAVRAAGRAALRLATSRARLEAVESTLAPLAVAYGARPVFRRLLLPVIEAELAAGVPREALGRRSAKVLVETLFEGDPGSKRRALSLLSALAPESAAKPLMVFAGSDADGDLRAKALVARAALEAEVEPSALTPLFGDADRRVRLAAAWAAHRGGTETMRHRLLESEDPRVRALLCLSFAERPSERAEAALAARFREDVNAEVRAAAALALGRLGARTPTLAEVALAAPPRERRAALVALAGATTPEAREALATGFFDESPVVRRTAQAAARALGAPRAAMRVEGLFRVTELLERFLEPEWAFRPSLEPLVPDLARAARAMMAGPVERKRSTLAVLNARESLDEAATARLAVELAEDVANLLREPDARVRQDAAAFLVTLTGEQAARALSEALADVEEVALAALDRFDADLTEEARVLVEGTAEGAGTWPLRRSAVALLARKGPAPSREVLQRVLGEDTHAIVRAEAAAALAGQTDATKALERAASTDESAAVRRAASLALQTTFD